jgi:SAM-dependent methyltransferase
MQAAGAPVRLMAADVDRVQLDPSSYDLIYAVQSFHHFDDLEHICTEISKALMPGGFFVLDEFVGPARFQWTGAQLALTSQILGLLPRNLRIYQNGIEKLQEGRSTPEEVIRVCPSEAIRSDQILRVFRKHFKVIHEKKLGGTIQHLLYSGIVHNFPDGDPATDHLIDCINGLEEVFIDHGILPSDFVLLIGQKR